MLTRVNFFAAWLIVMSPVTLISPIVNANILQPNLQYRVTVVKTDVGAEWLVALKMKGNASGVTALQVPSKWASRDDLGKGVQDFRVTGLGAVLEDDADGESPVSVSIRRVRHQPNADITVEYRLKRIGNVAPQSQNDAYSPVLHPDYFHVIGTGAWVVPSDKSNQEFNININWIMPADWAIANSFGVNQATQSFRTTIRAFTHALYLGGDFRLASFTLRDQPVYVAMRGDWGFFDENLTDLTKRVFEIERNFWNDHTQPFFLVSVIPIGQPNHGGNVGGTALENAFAMFLSPRTHLKDIRYLLTHELLHHWNPQKLGRMKSPEQLLYWWSEGVTDFYTQRLMRRSQLVTLEEYARAYNDVLKAYMHSPVRNAPNSLIEKEFWKTPAVGKLPYQRGMLFAHQLDLAISEATKSKFSLDNVMLDLLASGKKAGEAELNTNVLNAAITKRLGRTYAAEIKRFIDDGETIDLPDNALGNCFEKKQIAFRNFDAGFDIDASILVKKATGVQVAGPAYAAGLRDGMALGGWSIHSGDISKNIELTIIDGDKRNVIKYLPVSSVATVTPQFYLKPSLNVAARRACLQ